MALLKKLLENFWKLFSRDECCNHIYWLDFQNNKHNIFFPTVIHETMCPLGNAYQINTKRLAAKSIYDMTYLISSWTLNLNSVNYVPHKNLWHRFYLYWQDVLLVINTTVSKYQYHQWTGLILCSSATELLMEGALVLSCLLSDASTKLPHRYHQSEKMTDKIYRIIVTSATLVILSYRWWPGPKNRTSHPSGLISITLAGQYGYPVTLAYTNSWGRLCDK